MPVDLQMDRQRRSICQWEAAQRPRSRNKTMYPKVVESKAQDLKGDSVGSHCFLRVTGITFFSYPSACVPREQKPSPRKHKTIIPSGTKAIIPQAADTQAKFKYPISPTCLLQLIFFKPGSDQYSHILFDFISSAPRFFFCIFFATQHVGSTPPDEGQTHTSASEAHSLNGWTTREVLPQFFIFEKFISPEKCLESCNEHADGLYLLDPLSLSPVRVAAATCNCVFNHLPSFKPQETSLYFCFQLLLENQIWDRFPT